MEEKFENMHELTDDELGEVAGGYVYITPERFAVMPENLKVHS